MDKKLTHDTFIGLETLTKEYKVPSMNHIGTCISDEEAEVLLKNNNFVFNKAILKNLYKSMKFYFLKYFTAFMNSNLTKSEFYYGINDYGRVIGFPYEGKFNINIIQDICKTLLLSNNLKTSNSRINLINSFKIELLPVTYNKINDKYHYQLYKLQKDLNLDKMKKYYINYNKNMNAIKTYSTKLINIIKNHKTKKQLLEYIFHHLEFKNISLYFKLKKKINNFNFKRNTGYNIVEKSKHSKENVYYWLTRFKDDMIQFLIGLKNHKPSLNTKLSPNCLIGMVEPMIPNWMNHNPTLNLYVIKITFTHNNDYSKDFKYLYDNKYTYCVRSTDSFGNPCCTPF